MSAPFAPPVDLSHHLSRNGKARREAEIKKFYKYFAIPGIGQLAGGFPNDRYFPFDTFEARVALPNRHKPTPNQPVDPPPAASHAVAVSQDSRQGRLVVPHTAAASDDPFSTLDLRTALQYGQAQGYPPLYGWIRHFTRAHLHPTVPYRDGPEVVLTCGSTDGFAKSLLALSNEWAEGYDARHNREGILVEEHCYVNAVQTARARGLNIIPVAIDDEGMVVEGKRGLRNVLQTWDFSAGKRPHLMYTVTIGQNPTGCTMSVQRRKDIYTLAVRYDVVIVEDDPYWYLQYPSASSALKRPPSPARSSGFEFLDSLIPSYLSVDYQGRVVRLDTFSKTIAPGCRLGWITAQPALIERLVRITETTTQQPSGFVQSMVAELVVGPQGASDGGRGGAADGSGWKVDGWVRWLEGLRGNYERRMTAMCDILDAGKHVVKVGRRQSLQQATQTDDWWAIQTVRMFDFVRPLGGMFVWLRFDFLSHPLHRSSAFPALQLSRAL